MESGFPTDGYSNELPDARLDVAYDACFEALLEALEKSPKALSRESQSKPTTAVSSHGKQRRPIFYSVRYPAFALLPPSALAGYRHCYVMRTWNCTSPPIAHVVCPGEQMPCDGAQHSAPENGGVEVVSGAATRITKSAALKQLAHSWLTAGRCYY